MRCEQICVSEQYSVGVSAVRPNHDAEHHLEYARPKGVSRIILATEELRVLSVPFSNIPRIALVLLSEIS